MSKEQKITGNIQPPNKDLEILKQNFPSCFDKNGEFDFDKFKTQLSKNEINFSKESYGIDWLGKSYARLLATDETTTLLKEDETFNQKEENKNSENLLIKGDNLEVLKHLSNAYYEKVKMIYIDPPYNTGSDGFVYADDRKFTIDELQELAGVNEERAKRILDFTQSKSNSHSAWLTFMYPRLYIAKQLLKEDGVIFVSIDDNEVAQLRLLMDEIFGEENFVSEFIWEKKKKPSFLHKNVGKLSEYIICYVNNSNKTFPFSIEKTTEGKKYPFNNAGNSLEELTFPPKTVEFSIEDCTIKPQDMSEGKIITELLNELIIKDGLNENEFRLKGEWRYSQKTLDEIIKNKEKISISKIPFRPNHIKVGGEIKKMKNSFSPTHYEMETNEDATKQIVSLFGIDLFSNPKPTKLIETIIKAISYNDPKAIILDFFAGSGTTGDAVMQLNAGDNGKRKFILAQLPELIDPKSNKTAYDFVKNELKVEEPTIFDITKERLIRASKKIQEDNKDKDLSNQDLGFKVFETMPIWEDYNFESEELEKQTSLFDESKLTKEDIRALLVTWKTYDGVPLTTSIQEIDLNGYTAHYSSEKLYLMDKGFTTKNLKTLLEKIDSDKSFNPTTIIAFGYHFESKNLREISENIKSYANKKSIDIDFITRY
ncbi:site-specific DNA-methyltransferase [Altibacter lentus]|uniref:site-specific DNA-methyltransferase n=1 Tax=Altibacter lentus TaxID=1223410 RepID=UPI0005504D9B|nr:site-specific DNA-methyltransferase [Altibacter lentus]